jgi:hypothetical protein
VKVAARKCCSSNSGQLLLINEESAGCHVPRLLRREDSEDVRTSRLCSRYSGHMENLSDGSKKPVQSDFMVSTVSHVQTFKRTCIPHPSSAIAAQCAHMDVMHGRHLS